MTNLNLLEIRIAKAFGGFYKTFANLPSDSSEKEVIQAGKECAEEMDALLIAYKKHETGLYVFYSSPKAKKIVEKIQKDDKVTTHYIDLQGNLIPDLLKNGFVESPEILFLDGRACIKVYFEVDLCVVERIAYPIFNLKFEKGEEL